MDDLESVASLDVPTIAATLMERSRVIPDIPGRSSSKVIGAGQLPAKGLINDTAFPNTLEGVERSKIHSAFPEANGATTSSSPQDSEVSKSLPTTPLQDEEIDGNDVDDDPIAAVEPINIMAEAISESEQSAKNEQLPGQSSTIRSLTKRFRSAPDIPGRGSSKVIGSTQMSEVKNSTPPITVSTLETGTSASRSSESVKAVDQITFSNQINEEETSSTDMKEAPHQPATQSLSNLTRSIRETPGRNASQVIRLNESDTSMAAEIHLVDSSSPPAQELPFSELALISEPKSLPAFPEASEADDNEDSALDEMIESVLANTSVTPVPASSPPSSSEMSSDTRSHSPIPQSNDVEEAERPAAISPPSSFPESLPSKIRAIPEIPGRGSSKVIGSLQLGDVKEVISSDTIGASKILTALSEVQIETISSVLTPASDLSITSPASPPPPAQTPTPSVTSSEIRLISAIPRPEETFDDPEPPTAKPPSLTPTEILVLSSIPKPDEIDDDFGANLEDSGVLAKVEEDMKMLPPIPPPDEVDGDYEGPGTGGTLPSIPRPDEVDGDYEGPSVGKARLRMKSDGDIGKIRNKLLAKFATLIRI
ncbi:hypothetical protein HDU67_006574 [Dinochytrium kinnereticum]|nr:hypothetical protein HDU67_006574 [Dinochytrium kinnereticum]